MIKVGAHSPYESHTGTVVRVYCNEAGCPFQVDFPEGRDPTLVALMRVGLTHTCGQPAPELWNGRPVESHPQG